MRAAVDFLKVDTDGHDHDVLLGAEIMRGAERVLGVAVEAQFSGPLRTSSVFSAIDDFLRRREFSLFDIEVYRYSRAALPAPFQHEIPAQTVTGQMLWGHAIYFRDLGDPEYEGTWQFEPTTTEVLKLACLFELFGLLDCAAELMLKYRKRCNESESATYLDLLATEQARRRTTHAAFLREFEQEARRRFTAS